MASLANQTISSTYDGLIKTSTDQPVPISGVQLLEDGVGNSLALSVGRANQGVTVTGTLSATSITGVLADGVTATTQSAGDNSTKVATTAYVDSIVTAQDLDFAGDSGTGAVDLDSQSLTIAGTANEIETSASGQTVTIGLPSSVTVGTLNATTLGGTLSTAAQPNITSVGTLSSLAVSGNLTVDTDTLYVNASNNRVGIGTSSPAEDLHISATNAALRIDNDGAEELTIIAGFSTFGNYIQSYNRSGGTYEKITHRATEYIWNGGGGQEFVRIDTSGRLGIGTNSFSTFDKVRITGTNATANDLVLATPNTAQARIFFSDTDAEGVGELGYDHASNAMRIVTNGSEKVRIDSSGNVGIGTSSPLQRLDVKGSHTTGSAVAAWFGSSNASNSGLNGGVAITTDPTGLYGGLASLGTNAGLKFETNGTERMRITSGGNVVIGKSEIALNTRGIRLDTGGEYYASVPNSINTYHVYDINNTVYRFYVNGQGTVFATNTTISAISDARLKENIQDLKGGLDAVLSLRPRTYDWKEGSGQTGTGVKGFIAQEVEEVFPEYVDEYLTEELPEDGVPYKSVRQDFVPFLVKAIQEQQEIINDLKARIETLETK